MPFKNRAKQRASQRASMTKLRRKRAGPGTRRAPSVAVNAVADPAGAFAAWAEKRLKIPPGHPNAGQPLIIPPYALAFLREALAPGVREAGLFVARKNAKSAVIAALALAHLAPDGPLRRKGWRAGFASLSREKSRRIVATGV